ncbi:reverse transcriptase domain-containing protein [Tanacetum coccineum]|uniref:RNA-directed DNA polymerase n=1 Tax=Tanacetum coccineum TaxID=301880 RepID=A0ABQ4ZAK0_9ASTR
MPKYAKFLKGLLSNKTRLEEACTVTINERCSTVLLNKLPSKEKDSGSFTIPCDIGHLHINNALADLGASISLMPYMMYEKLGLGEPKPTRMSLELADRSIQYPRGIAENVLIKIDKFILPIDLVILDMREDSKIPIILGRPFLATARAMIDVFNKKITLRVGNEELLEDDQLDSFMVNNLEENVNLSDLESCGGCCLNYATLRQPFQRCMTAIFHDMVEDFMEVLMDGFSEKCHFMVKDGIVFGHKTFGKGIEVDKAKINVIAKLPYPSNVKGVRSFLGHAGFYRRFIKDFSMISKPMTQLLMKDAKFDFYEDCKKAFNKLKEKLTTAPIIISPDWNEPFELMCDASDFAVGAVLGQRIDRKFKPIYYASKTLNDSQAHYTTTEKELLAVVFSFDKFIPYLILSKTIVYTDHSALKYLFSKQDAKPRLIRWVLLLQGFNIEIKDKKGAENLAADHLSRLENPNIGELAKDEITDKFPDEHLMILKAKLNDKEPWYADYINYIVGKVVPPKWTSERRKRFFSQGRNYFWDEPFAFRLCPDNVMRRCVAGNKIFEILAHCHFGPTRGHHSAIITGRKVNEAGFFWPNIFKDAKDYVEAQALHTNDARVMVKFLKGLFARFGVPKALISDRGTHFYNSQLEKALLKYEVTHKISTAHHPHTNGQIEVTNRAIKRILERLVGYNPKDWSKKLNGALWAFRTCRILDIITQANG